MDRLELMFTAHVKTVYKQEAEIERHESQRKELIREYDVQSFRVKEEILHSHGELNLIHKNDFDLVQKQLWRIQDSFSESAPYTQSNILHHYEVRP